MSQEEKWTPGQWHAFVSCNSGRWTVASRNGPLIADYGLAENKYSGANARLAATAKRLYELVEDAVEDETEFETEWNRLARAVLAEARGER